MSDEHAIGLAAAIFTIACPIVGPTPGAALTAVTGVLYFLLRPFLSYLLIPVYF